MHMKEQFELQLPDLLHFIKLSCHESLHDTLSELREMTDNILKTEKENPDFPVLLPGFMKNFIRDIQVHLALEENTLFPSISRGRSDTDSIPHLVDDHDNMRLSLLTIRRMTSNYQLPDDLNVNVLHYYRKLREMDRIILNHIQLEDHILFPMVLKTS